MLLVGPTIGGTKASIYILIGDGINRTLLLGNLGAHSRMYPREEVLHSTLIELRSHVDYYWKSEKGEHRVIEDGETEEMMRCEAAEPWTHCERALVEGNTF